MKPFVAVKEFKKPKDMWACPWVKFTHDSEGLVALNSEGYLVLWDSESTKLLKTSHLTKAHYGPNVWISPDRLTLAVGGSGATFFINTKTLKATKRLPFDASELSWSRNGQLIAATQPNSDTWIHRVHVYRAKDCKEIGSFEPPKHSGGAQFWGDTTELIFTGNGVIATWNARAQKFIRRARFVENVHPIAWSNDGKIFVHRKGSKTAFLDTTSWKSHQLGVPDKAEHFALSADGKRLAMTVGNTIVIWDLVENQPWLKWKRPHYGSAISVDFSHDGQRVACTPDHEVHILDFRTGARDQVIELPKPKAGEVQCLNMVGPDDRMDTDHWTPINPLTVKCDVCKSIDLNSVSTPYALGRKIESPVDTAPAVAGNLLVRDSMKRMFEVAVPGRCRFYSTIHRKTEQPTAWWLAVPQHIQTTAVPKGKSCTNCAEPLDWEEVEMTRNPCSTQDVFKSRNLRWEEHEHYLYFSVRLEVLFTKLKLRGLVRSADCKQLPTPEDLAWVETKWHLLQQAASNTISTGKPDGAKAWFKDYLKKNAKKHRVVHDFAAFETRHGVKLPQSYKEFVATVGRKTFKDIDGEEGFRVHILPPKQLVIEECSERGADEEETFKGVLFGETDHGDAFYFATSGTSHDYEVRKHDHELGSYEPYAKNFAEAIKRFAAR